MITVRAACLSVVEQLEAAEISASIDPDQLSVPGVWVQPRSLTDPTLAGGGTLVVWLYLIGPNTETPTAMERLDELLDAVLELELPLASTDDVIDLAAAVALPSNPAQPLPAYRVAIDLDL